MWIEGRKIHKFQGNKTKDEGRWITVLESQDGYGMTSRLLGSPRVHVFEWYLNQSHGN